MPFRTEDRPTADSISRAQRDFVSADKREYDRAFMRGGRPGHVVELAKILNSRRDLILGDCLHQ